MLHRSMSNLVNVLNFATVSQLIQGKTLAYFNRYANRPLIRVGKLTLH